MTLSTKKPWTGRVPPPRAETQADALYDLRVVVYAQWRSFRGSLTAKPESAWSFALLAIIGGPMLLSLWVVLFSSIVGTFSGRTPASTDAAAVNVVGIGFPMIASMFTLMSAGTTLAHASVMPLLFTLPLRRKAILGGITLQLAVVAAWGGFLLTAPSLGLLAARGHLTTGALPVFLTSLAASLSMSCIAVFLGATVVRLVPSGRWREWTLIFASSGGLMLFYGMQALANRAVSAQDPRQYLMEVGRWIPGWAPPAWPGGVAALFDHAHVLVGYGVAVGALGATGLLCWGLLTVLDRLYRGGLGSAPTNGGADRSSARGQLRGTRSRMDGQVQAVCRREWRRLTRSPRLLAAGLTTIIPCLAPWITNGGAGTTTGLRTAVAVALTLATAGVSLAMVGNEEGAFWLTRLSPMTDQSIVRGKALAIGLLFGCIGTVVIAVAGPFIGFTAHDYVLALVQSGLGVLVGTGAGLAGACSEPLFHSPNKQQYVGISAALAGTFGIFAWLGVMAGIRLVMRYTVDDRLGSTTSEWLFTAGALLMNAPIIYVLYAKAARSLSKLTLKA